MLIQMLTRLAGPELQAAPGQQIDLDPGVAEPLVDGGFATLVDRPPEYEEETEEPKKRRRK